VPGEIATGIRQKGEGGNLAALAVPEPRTALPAAPRAQANTLVLTHFSEIMVHQSVASPCNTYW
jgi:hypothetical protein